MMRTLRMLAVLGAAVATPALAEDPPADSSAGAPAEAPAAPVRYRLDPAKSWLYVVVYNDTTAMASRMGHDHGIRASTFEGAVTWHMDDASACDVQISFPVTALIPDPAGMRERAGLAAEGAVGEGGLKTIKDNLLSKHQLDSTSFPTISYKSKSCDGTTGKVKVTGDLTIHGVTQPVTLTMNVSADGSTFKASGSTTLLHSSFGFKPFSNLAGALRNKDELKLVVDVVGAKTE